MKLFIIFQPKVTPSELSFILMAMNTRRQQMTKAQEIILDSNCATSKQLAKKMWNHLLCTYNNILKNGDVLSDCFRCFVVGIGLAPLIGARPYLKKHVLSVLCNEVKREQNILAIQNICLEPTFFYHVPYHQILP